MRDLRVFIFPNASISLCLGLDSTILISQGVEGCWGGVGGGTKEVFGWLDFPREPSVEVGGILRSKLGGKKSSYAEHREE